MDSLKTIVYDRQMNPPSFSTPPSHLRLSANEVHIWTASLTQSKMKIDEFSRVLSKDERSRSKRFYFDIDRERYIIAHGILRFILGRCLDLEPDHLQFCYGKNKKPEMLKKYCNEEIRFNLSCSKDIALYAFTLYHEIGVDVELVHDIPERDQIAERFFSPKEQNIYRSLSDSDKLDLFFQILDEKKEALCKAIGDGLMLPIECLDVSEVPNEPVILLKKEDGTNISPQWFIYDLNIGPGCKAAFAVEEQCSQIMCFKWTNK